jgi:hypothetical protein
MKYDMKFLLVCDIHFYKKQCYIFVLLLWSETILRQHPPCDKNRMASTLSERATEEIRKRIYMLLKTN